jgi:transposase
MRKGMNGLALQVQQALGRDPHAGDLYVFRGARGDLIKPTFAGYRWFCGQRRPCHRLRQRLIGVATGKE